MAQKLLPVIAEKDDSQETTPAGEPALEKQVQKLKLNDVE
jgi:hypothetical protein